MNHQQLNKTIKDKFGTIANFCELAKPKQDYDKTKRFLARKPKRGITAGEQERIDALAAVCSKTQNPNDTGKRLTEEDRISIWIAIRQISGSQKKFCEQYPQWDYRFITDITGNNIKKVSRKTDKVIQLMDFLDKKTGK